MEILQFYTAMNLITLFFLIALGIFSRLVPHPANFTLIGSIALFAPAILPGKKSLLAALGALFLSDMVIGFYDLRLMFVVYASVLISGFLGQWISKNISAGRIIGGSLAGSIFFYLSTNFAVWYFSYWYPHNLQGLLTNYVSALPFFRNALLADLIFSFTLFYSYAYIRKRITSPPRTIILSKT